MPTTKASDSGHMPHTGTHIHTGPNARPVVCRRQRTPHTTFAIPPFFWASLPPLSLSRVDPDPTAIPPHTRANRQPPAGAARAGTAASIDFDRKRGRGGGRLPALWRAGARRRRRLRLVGLEGGWLPNHRPLGEVVIACSSPSRLLLVAAARAIGGTPLAAAPYGVSICGRVGRPVRFWIGSGGCWGVSIDSSERTGPTQSAHLADDSSIASHPAHAYTHTSITYTQAHSHVHHTHIHSHNDNQTGSLGPTLS